MRPAQQVCSKGLLMNFPEQQRVLKWICVSCSQCGRVIKVGFLLVLLLRLHHDQEGDLFLLLVVWSAKKKRIHSPALFVLTGRYDGLAIISLDWEVHGLDSIPCFCTVVLLSKTLSFHRASHYTGVHRYRQIACERNLTQGYLLCLLLVL